MNNKQAHADAGSTTGLHTLEVISQAGYFNKWMYDTISPLLKGSLLEVGSGIGNISAYAILEGHTITLSDYEASYCTLLEKRFGANENVREVISLNLQSAGFSTAYVRHKERYDTIFMLNVIEHLADDAAAIENCRYLLRPGGTLVVLAPAYRFLYSRFDRELGHHRRYTAGSLQRLFLSQQFTVTGRQYFNYFGLAGWFIFSKCLGRSAIGRSEMRLYNRLVPLFRFADRLVFKKAGLSVIVSGKKN